VRTAADTSEDADLAAALALSMEQARCATDGAAAMRMNE
jgi:hypothetical protein